MSQEAQDLLSHLPERRRKSISPDELEEIASLAQRIKKTKKPIIKAKSQRLPDGRFRYDLTVVARDWAGLLDAVSGVIHEMGYNIQYLEAFATSDGTVAYIFMSLLLDEEAKKEFEAKKSYIQNLLRTAALGGGSIKTLVGVGAKKLRIYAAMLRELEEMAKSGAVTKEELREIVKAGGELEKFIASRTEAYLSEREVRDLAKLVVLNHRFLKEVRKTKGTRVHVEPIKAKKEGEMTGITVAGLDRHVSLDDVLEAIKELAPHLKKRYDKEFITDDGVSVVRVEATPSLPGEECRALASFLAKRLSSPMRRELRLRSGAELYGRIVVPRLIDECATTERPQILILPEGFEEGRVYFKLIGVAPKAEEPISSRVAQSLEARGVAVLNSKETVTKKEGKELAVLFLSLAVDPTPYSSEEEIYEVLRDGIGAVLPNYRDFDEGMRRMGIERLRRVTQLVGGRMSARLLKKFFYQLDDSYRVTTRPEELAEELLMARDLLTAYLRTNDIQVDYLVEDNQLVVGVAGAGDEVRAEELAGFFSQRGIRAIVNGMEAFGVVIFLFKISRGEAGDAEALANELLEAMRKKSKEEV